MVRSGSPTRTTRSVLFLGLVLRRGARRAGHRHHLDRIDPIAGVVVAAPHRNAAGCAAPATMAARSASENRRCLPSSALSPFGWVIWLGAGVGAVVEVWTLLRLTGWVMAWRSSPGTCSGR